MQRSKIQKQIRDALEIKKSNCNNSDFNLDYNDGDFVKTNSQTPLLKDIINLENGLRNPRAHCKTDVA